MAQEVGHSKRSRPTSDPSGDLGGALGRLINEVGLLQKAAVRYLPRRYRMEMEETKGEPVALVLVDTRKKRKARIELVWEKM